jgi:ATP-binding protein involved in chromosome partitioning
MNAHPPPADGLPGSHDIRSIVAIASGKGGVGKSTVSANLAVALAAEGAATGLLDADIYGPSIPTLMGVRQRPGSRDGRILPVEAHGVSLMSLGFLMPEGAPAVWRGPMVAGAVRQLLQDVAWGRLDYLLIDLPPGTGDAQLTLAQSVPLAGAVIVATPQEVATQIASKALAMFQQLRVPILGILENMSQFVCPHCGLISPVFRQGGGRRAGERLGVPLLGEIPLDPAICRASDAGRPIVLDQPESPVARAFRQVAAALRTAVAAAAAAGPAIRMDA